MTTGKIAKLVALTTQTHVENSQVIPGHNDQGYGQIDAVEGESIYFPYDAVEGCRFEELWVGQEVDFEQDPRQADYARRVTLLNDDPDLAKGGVTMPPPLSEKVPPLSRASVQTEQAPDKQENRAMNEQENNELLPALAELERQLETPVVPGELEPWLEATGRHLTATGNSLKGVVENVHPEEIASIAKEDPELQPRAEQLQAEDARLLEEFAELSHEFERLQPAVKSVSPDEGKADDLMKQFIDRSLSLVIAIRKQEQSLKTWMLESLERDRGDVD